MALEERRRHGLSVQPLIFKDLRSALSVSSD